MSMIEELLKRCYDEEEDYVEGVGQREFDCLIALVEDGTIATHEELDNYL